MFVLFSFALLCLSLTTEDVMQCLQFCVYVCVCVCAHMRVFEQDNSKSCGQKFSGLRLKQLILSTIRIAGDCRSRLCMDLIRVFITRNAVLFYEFCLSVRLSDQCWCCVKTNGHILVLFVALVWASFWSFYSPTAMTKFQVDDKCMRQLENFAS